MDISVAIGTLRTYVLEDQAGVALAATHFRVHPAQWVSGLIVIEFGIRPDRLPTGVGVAARAGGGNRAMGISHLGLGAHTHAYARTPT